MLDYTCRALNPKKVAKLYLIPRKVQSLATRDTKSCLFARKNRVTRSTSRDQVSKSDNTDDARSARSLSYYLTVRISAYERTTIVNNSALRIYTTKTNVKATKYTYYEIDVR